MGTVASARKPRNPMTEAYAPPIACSDPVGRHDRSDNRHELSVAGAVGARNSHVRTQEHDPEKRIPAFGKNMLWPE
jgi:hypothetical protein